MLKAKATLETTGFVDGPTRATQGSAGYDLSADLKDRTVKMYDNFNVPYSIKTFDELTIPAGHRALIPNGFKATIPEGTFATIGLRSSTGLKSGLVIPNAPPVIDSDYPGDWHTIVLNTSSVPVTIMHGEKIAQAVILMYVAIDWVPGEVGQTTDRTGGFGSTNK